MSSQSKKQIRKDTNKSKTLKRLPSGKITIFKIKNRAGYAALCQYHLTEGSTVLIAFDRMVKAMKRSGYEVVGKPKSPKK